MLGTNTTSKNKNNPSMQDPSDAAPIAALAKITLPTKNALFCLFIRNYNMYKKLQHVVTMTTNPVVFWLPW